MSKKNHEILIVGGGPAGISTWLHLNKYNPEIASKCVLIEKKKYPRDKLCGGAVGGWSENVLKNLRIKLDIPHIWVNQVEFHYKNEIYNLKQSKYFRMVNRAEFDNSLAKSAKDRGLIIHEEEEFQNFSKTNDGLRIVTNKDKYEVKVLIGADGALSNIAKKVNVTYGPKLAPTIEIFTPVNNVDKEFEEKKAIFNFNPIKEGLQGYVWHFPCLKDNKPFMNHGIVNFRVHKNKKCDMKTIFSEELDKRGIQYNTNQWLGHPIKWYSDSHKISAPNILLIGDAAGIESATGGGIHLALSYGEIAAKTIIESYEMDDFLFKTYKKRFEGHIAGKFIKKLNFLASEMYNETISPIKAMNEIFKRK